MCRKRSTSWDKTWTGTYKPCHSGGPLELLLRFKNHLEVHLAPISPGQSSWDNENEQYGGVWKVIQKRLGFWS